MLLALLIAITVIRVRVLAGAEQPVRRHFGASR